MLQLDRVTVVEGQATGFVDVTGHWAFPVHFPSDPIFPGTLLIEAAGQTVAVWAWHNGLRGRPRLVRVDARFASPVLPQDSMVTLVARVRRRGRICLGSIDVSVGDRNIAGIAATIIIVPK